jgi:hypothetical protein
MHKKKIQEKQMSEEEKAPEAQETPKPEGTEEKQETKPETPAPKEATVYDLKLPDGSTLDAKAIEDVKAYAKANGLDNKQAQAQLERENANYAAYVEGQRKQLAEEMEGWKKTFETDKEIGGAKAKESAENAKRLLSKVMADRPEFIKELDATGLGNHPDFVRLLVRLSKGTSEDKLVVSGAQETPELKPTTEVLFPSMAKKE